MSGEREIDKQKQSSTVFSAAQYKGIAAYDHLQRLLEVILGWSVKSLKQENIQY
jgi:hypothetical protein